MGGFVAALGCRVLFWIFAVFAAGDVQFGKDGQPGPAATRLVAALSAAPAEERRGDLRNLLHADPLIEPKPGDRGDTFDEPGLASLLDPPKRTRLTVVATGIADLPADRTPTGIASARAPPLSLQS